MNFYAIKKILVALDLSETSLNALDTAAAMAKQNKAVLFLLNVGETGVEISEERGKLNYSAQASPDVLTALSVSVGHTYGIKTKLLQRDGNAAEKIVSTATDENCDLIIIGTHGASGIREGFIGSNAYSVIKYSACPVLTIPPYRKFTSFKKILFPIRPVTGALTAYNVVSHLLSSNSSMQVLGLSYLAMEKDTGVLSRIADEIKDQLTEDKTQVNTSWGEGSSVSDDILNFIQRNPPQLIVLTSVLDAVNKPNFIGPHTQKVIHCSKIPLLNIKKIGVPAYA